jgi:ABC-2 type transport system ATP-binding protein
MSGHPAIRCSGLTKYYGETLGINELELEVAAGELFGFLGPNGAGKTTTIRLLLDLIRPTSGLVEVFGLDPRAHSVEVRRTIGYLPGELSLYEGLTGHQLFTYFASLRRGKSLDYAVELCERLDLDHSRSIGDLSKGNKQKVGLVQALMHRPPLLVLDEPTSGLDPLIQHEFHSILTEIAAEGRTVFLSSHVLAEVEHMASRVGIIRRGTLVAIEDVAALSSRVTRRFDFHFANGAPSLVWPDIPGVIDAHVVDDTAHLTVEGSVDPLLKALAQHEILDIVSRESDLEEIFLSYYEDEDDA